MIDRNNDALRGAAGQVAQGRLARAAAQRRWVVLSKAQRAGKKLKDRF